MQTTVKRSYLLPTNEGALCAGRDVVPNELRKD